MELKKSLTEGVNQFESEVAKAKDQIDSIGEQTKEQYQNWKRVLSGALNDRQLIIALIILFGFYLLVSGFNTVLGGNARIENTITCACPAGHSSYYRTLVIVTIVIWVTCFIVTTIWDTVKFWRYVIVLGKRSHRDHQTFLEGDINDAEDHAPSMSERAISSVEEGVQAARKIPVKSIFTKAKGMVEDTIEMVDEGAKVLHNGLKEVKEKPLESMLNMSMEVVDGVVMHRLESGDENTAPKSKASEATKLPTAAKSLMNKGTEIVSIAKQDPTLAKVVDPLDEKAQQIKHSSVGSMLTKSVELVEDGMQTMNQNPAELMVSRAMDFVDDNAQINSAELIATPKELIDVVEENSTDLLLAGPMNVLDDVDGSNAMQLATGQKSEAMRDEMSTSSMLSTASGVVHTGLESMKQGPDELALSKAMEFAIDDHETPQSNPVISKTVGFITSEDPAESLLHVEMAEQNPAVTETVTSLTIGSLAADRSLVSNAAGMIDSRIQVMEQNPENTTFTKAVGFTEKDDHAEQLLPVLATDALSNQASSESQVSAGQGNPKSMLNDAAKSVASKKIKKSHSKKSLRHARKLTEADTNALSRLKNYEDYLWLQFYKIYSVGATLEGEDQTLPAFINVVGGDHREESDRYETTKEDEIKPLIEEKNQGAPDYPETELIEVPDSYNVDDNIPTIVIEADFSGENHHHDGTGGGHKNSDNVTPTIVIESDTSGEIPDTTSCYDTRYIDISDSTAPKNDIDYQTTSHHATNLVNTNQNDSTLDLTPATDHPLARTKLTHYESNTSLLSVKSNSTYPNSAQSTTSLLSNKSNASEDFKSLASWIYFKPIGLYNEATDEENVVMQVADATCARVGFCIYPLLVLTRLISQLILVPLLLFQILDTYAWICITDNTYCSSIVNQYRLGLDKAALAFAFYCCLLASILATAILRWFPCSKYARKAGATCIM